MSQSATKHMTVKDVAGELNVSVGKVHKIISEGGLPAVDIGEGSKSYWRVSREDFDQYLADQRAKTAARFRKSA